MHRSRAKWVPALVSEKFRKSKKATPLSFICTHSKHNNTITNSYDLIKIYHGDIITVKRSKFQAHLAAITTVDDVKKVKSFVMKDRKYAKATHFIMAYRLLNQFDPNNNIQVGSDDDGETGAGTKLMFLLEKMKVQNKVIIVTRWFGGIKLGASRFKYINESAKGLIENYRNEKQSQS